MPSQEDFFSNAVKRFKKEFGNRSLKRIMFPRFTVFVGSEAHDVSTRKDGSISVSAWQLHSAEAKRFDTCEEAIAYAKAIPVVQEGETLAGTAIKTLANHARRMMNRFKAENQWNMRGVIYADAGFLRETKTARLCAVQIETWDEFTIRIRDINCGTSIKAEVAAIKFALEYTNRGTIVFSDCLPAVQQFDGTNVVFIPRWKNTVADSFGNLRKKRETDGT